MLPEILRECYNIWYCFSEMSSKISYPGGIGPQTGEQAGAGRRTKGLLAISPVKSGSRS